MKKSVSKQVMEKGTLLFLALSVICLTGWLILGYGVLLTLFIAFATFLYHLAIRLAVGGILNKLTAGGGGYK